MSKAKTTSNPKHLQPVSNNQPIELANSPAAWHRLDARIEKAVDAICQHDDQEVVDALLLITDLLGNSSFTSRLRDGVLCAVQKYTYRHTTECEMALQQYLDRLNPARKRSAS